MRIKSEEKEAESSDFKTTYYAYSYSGNVLMEESTGNSSDDSSETNYTSYIYAFAKTFAKVDGILDPTTITTTEIAYFHHDNQGSNRLMIDSSGKILMDQDYQPFGGDLARKDQVEVYNEIGVQYKYTGPKEVVSIGLYYYGARYYDPSIGRFITEDSYPGEIANPQTQNLYLYVINNPLRYTDPTGHFIQESSEQRRPDDDPYPGSKSDREVINPNSGSSGSKSSINGMDLDLDTYTDLNGDYSFENDWDMVTGVDVKISLDQVLNNVDIENQENISWRSDIDRKEFIGKMGVKLYEYHEGNTLETLADTANLIKYLAQDNTRQFIDDLVDAFSSRKKFGLLFNSNYENENIERILAKKYKKRWIAPTGFNKKLYDSLDPGADQTHHFVAFVQAGYEIGTLGFIASRLWETLNNKGRANPGDVSLGDFGVVAGLDVANAEYCYPLQVDENSFWYNPGNWIRTNLGGSWKDYNTEFTVYGYRIKLEY